jgi:Sigma-70 region 2
MATTQLNAVLRHVRQIATKHNADDLGDSQLLAEFAHRGAEATFAAILKRHGAMVLRVCRRVLQHEQDAEDAFQATFLVWRAGPRPSARRKRSQAGCTGSRTVWP